MRTNLNLISMSNSMIVKSSKWALVNTVVLAACISSCKKKTEESKPVGAYETGVLIVNEGKFTGGVGSISHYNSDRKEVTNGIFKNANGFDLGNVVQSIHYANGKGYIVVNNANKIEVVNTSDFKSVATISGLTQPRYFQAINSSKGYVTEWGKGNVASSVKIIDLNSNAIIGTIPTGKGAENLIKIGNKVYVACSGGNDNDEVITVIDTETDKVTATITVGANPSSIVEDANGKVWVLCTGKYKSDWSGLEKSGQLVRLNPSSNVVELSIDFNSMTTKPSNLTINGTKNKLFYSFAGSVYSHDITATTLSTTSIIKRNFYGLGIEPKTDYIYGADAGGFSNAGKVIRFKPTGEAIDSMTVDVAPNGFLFN